MLRWPCIAIYAAAMQQHVVIYEDDVTTHHILHTLTVVASWAGQGWKPARASLPSCPIVETSDEMLLLNNQPTHRRAVAVRLLERLRHRL